MGAGSHPYSIAISPSGKFLYVANYYAHNIFSYSVNPTTGNLRQTGSAVTGGAPQSVTVHPFGKFVYVASQESYTTGSNTPPGSVSAYTLDQTTGTLTPLQTISAGGSPAVLAGGQTESVTVDPSGQYAYVASRASSDVSIYWIDSSTGKLTDKGKVTARSPTSIAISKGSAPVTYKPKFAYVPNELNDSISVFTIDPTTGALTQIDSDPTIPGIQNVNAGGTGPVSVAVHPSGKFAYVANMGSNNVSYFRTDPITGALRFIVTEAAGTGPASIVVDPSGQFAFVANETSNNISAYKIDPTAGVLTAAGTVASGTGPVSVTVDPTGKKVNEVNFISNTLSVYEIDPTLPGILRGGQWPFYFGKGPRSLAIHPSGRFVYIANYSSNNISVYSTVGLNLMKNWVGDVASGTGPVSIAIEPRGRFAYVANELSNDVSIYAINQTTGALTLVGTIRQRNNPVSVNIDPSGRFAYITRITGTVSEYSIDWSTGALTFVGDYGGGSRSMTIVGTIQ